MSKKAQTASTKTTKRILSVTVVRAVDDDPDTSYLGEFSDNPAQYAIVHVGDHAGQFVDKLPCTCGHPDHSNNVDEICGATVETSSCDCDYYQADLPERGREFRYFNPNADSYTGSEAEIEKYCQRDYKRMEDYNRGGWCYTGTYAQAEVQTSQHSTIQTIRSGGLWGTESDSDDSHFAEIEKDELATLRSELEAIGFSKRAVSAAFRNIEHKDA